MAHYRAELTGVFGDPVDDKLTYSYYLSDFLISVSESLAVLAVYE
jgi:hypothetical protein